MRPVIRAALFSTALALGSAALAAPAGPSAPVGFKFKKDNVLIHEASGTRFPLLLAGFTRVAVQPFDANGHDVAIAYRETIDGQPVVVRVGLIHVVGMTPQEHYLGMKGIVGTYFQDLHPTHVVPRGEGPFAAAGMKPGSGYQGRFAGQMGRTPYELSLTTVSFGYWSARLTAAYPAATSAKARADITALAGALRLTGPKGPKRKG